MSIQELLDRGDGRLLTLDQVEQYAIEIDSPLLKIACSGVRHGQATFEEAMKLTAIHAAKALRDAQKQAMLARLAAAIPMGYA